MKKQIPTFLAGMFTTVLIGTLSIGALAASGALTISVDPINIQVNGATFTPTDEQGASVPVFAYNGTTYAPLRALAEAYGLEVGYDAGSNMATVGAKASDPATTPTPDTTVSVDYSDWTAEEEKAYQEFKGMWEVALLKQVDGLGASYTAKYNGSFSKDELTTYLQQIGDKGFNLFSLRLLKSQYVTQEERSALMFSSPIISNYGNNIGGVYIDHYNWVSGGLSEEFCTA